MERSNVAWKLFGAYLLILVLMVCAGTANAQIKVMIEKIEDKIYE